MKTDVERIFERDYARSKEDVLSIIDQYIKEIEKDETITTEQGQEFIRSYKGLARQVEAAELPALDDQFEYYDVRFTGYGLELVRCIATDIQVNEADDMIESVSCSDIERLAIVKCRFVPAEEFASILHVKTETVEVWQNNGKLKYLEKKGDTILIAATCDSRGDLDTHCFIAKDENGFSFGGVTNVRTAYFCYEPDCVCYLETKDGKNVERRMSKEMASYCEFLLAIDPKVLADAPINKVFSPIRI